LGLTTIDEHTDPTTEQKYLRCSPARRNFLMLYLTTHQSFKLLSKQNTADAVGTASKLTLAGRTCGSPAARPETNHNLPPCTRVGERDGRSPGNIRNLPPYRATGRPSVRPLRTYVPGARSRVRHLRGYVQRAAAFPFCVRRHRSTATAGRVRGHRRTARTGQATADGGTTANHSWCHPV